MPLDKYMHASSCFSFRLHAGWTRVATHCAHVTVSPSNSTASGSQSRQSLEQHLGLGMHNVDSSQAQLSELTLRPSPLRRNIYKSILTPKIVHLCFPATAGLALIALQCTVGAVYYEEKRSNTHANERGNDNEERIARQRWEGKCPVRISESAQ